MMKKSFKAELVFISATLFFLFAIRIYISIQLKELGAFEQYNVFFDSDPNQYVSAIANGWGFSLFNHPAYALLINVPVRALDFVAAHLGLISTGAIRNLAPVVVSPIVACLGGGLWWIAAWRAGFSSMARICGFLFSQLAFSQTLFSVIPESFSISGALLSALLVLSVNAANDPSALSSNRVQIQWLALACLMSMITVTNGFLCVAVWMAIRFDKKNFRPMIKEGIVASVVLGCVIATSLMADQLVYQRQAVTNSKSTDSPVAWTLNSDLDRITGIPAGYVASVFAPHVEKIPNLVISSSDRYQFGFGLEAGSKSLYMRICGWLMIATLAVLLIRQQGFSVTVRAIAAVLIFNGVLHSFFGHEFFLYSQHWLAFITFALIAPFSGKESQRSNTVLLIFVCSALVMSLNAWASMFEMLTHNI